MRGSANAHSFTHAIDAVINHCNISYQRFTGVDINYYKPPVAVHAHTLKRATGILNIRHGLETSSVWHCSLQTDRASVSSMSIKPACTSTGTIQP